MKTPYFYQYVFTLQRFQTKINLPISIRSLYLTSQGTRRYSIINNLSALRKQNGSSNIQGNLVTTSVKWIHHSTILCYRVEKPPLKELPNIDVLVSRKLFLADIVYYFDLMKEKQTGMRFIKISEVNLNQSRKRAHIVVGLTDVHSFINILNEGKHKGAIDDGETYGVLEESKVFEDKRYEFNVWGSGKYTKRVQIEIKETGRAYPSLIKNRDPNMEHGIFRIIISTAHLQGFINELDEVILDANEL